jgi:hypothetical protein
MALSPEGMVTQPQNRPFIRVEKAAVTGEKEKEAGQE